MIGLQFIIDEAEHQRQEWDFEHDVDEHGSDRLMIAASILLTGTEISKDNSTVPWAIELWEKHQDDPKRRAMIAGALCAASLDVMTFEIGVKAMKPCR